MAIGEIFLSAFITVLFDKLLYPELIELARREGLHPAIHKLEKTLRDIEAVLNDAESKQMTDRAIKLWLEELQDLAYDADDVLDEFAYEALRLKLMAESQSSTTRSKVHRLIPSCCASFGPTALAFNREIESKIKEINSQLDDIATRRSTLGLVVQELSVGETSKKEWHGPPTTSLVMEPFIHGRNKDKEEIIKLLLISSPSHETNFDVIPIVGMGGIGKTTLAQHVSNDERVGNHFNLKAWVCVSDEDLDVTRITRAILESFTLTPCDLKELNALQLQLNETLKGKKFLLVLDDVWNMRSDEWNVLRSPFRAGAQGSKIIVTTRDSDVALQLGTVNYPRLENLSNDDCWLIFAQHAFQNTNISEHPNLEFTGKKIVEKCSGLPLAARTLGSLLRFKHGNKDWEDVLNSKIWNLSSKENNILPALKLSYHHLPSHLKRCFAYCAVIPNDYAFGEEEVVLLWMAQGLIQKPEGNQQIEDLGRQYFDELVSRSLFQSSGSDSSLFVMHDLINDLAKVVAGKMCFWLDNMSESGSQKKIPKMARHFSYIAGYLDGVKRFEHLGEADRLRTFLSLKSRYPDGYITSYVLCDLLPRLKCLRVLSLSNYHIVELPDSIGDLKHLRYLNLSHTGIRRLPNSAGTLYNLEVLLLKNCCSLEELPVNMGNMINLRHLDFTHGAWSLKDMPLQMGKLTNLHTLSGFVVGEGSGSSIRQLRNLQQLRGTISISSLENVTDARDAQEVNLKCKQGIKVLSLQWSRFGKTGSGINVGIQTDVLDFLQPHPSLEQLTIEGYGGTRFPSWLGDGSLIFSSMVSLKLISCPNCKSLPPLGHLPSLKELLIRQMNGVEQVGREFYGEGCSKPFRSLANLTFALMKKWKHWFSFEVNEEIDPFPHLIKLSISDCPKLLGKLPSHLPSLKELLIDKCPQLEVALPSLGMLHETRNSVDFRSLTNLSISDVPIPAFLCNTDVAADEVVLAHATSNQLKSLTRLYVKGSPNLTSFPLWFIQGLTGLEELEIVDCGELASLWVCPNKVQLQHQLPALRHLVIQSCPQLFCLLKENDKEEEGKHEELPCMRMLEYLEIIQCEILEKLPRDLHTLEFLQDLVITDCPRLISLPSTQRRLKISGHLIEGLMHNNSLEELHVDGCPSLTSLSFPKTGTLRRLHITECRALESLTEVLMHNNNIEELAVNRCESLMSLSSGCGLPPTLKFLSIFGCGKLESIVDEGLKSNSSLELVTIQNCVNLKSLPDGPRDLSDLEIRDCDNLESLPEGWLSSTSLRQLTIHKCRKLEALPNRGNFRATTSLNSLSIPYSSELGLHRLSCLRLLHISGSSLSQDLVSFPGRGMPLPTFLTELKIRDFPNLKSLSSEFQNLVSLESLSVRYCPKLTSFPDKGLPPSLLELWINGCPLLQQRCERKRGQYWHMIVNIPAVRFDGRLQVLL